MLDLVLEPGELLNNLLALFALLGIIGVGNGPIGIIDGLGLPIVSR